MWHLGSPIGWPLSVPYIREPVVLRRYWRYGGEWVRPWRD